MKRGSELCPRMNKFYVEMDASFMHTMNIPKKFAKMFKGSENIKLEAPTGITWKVKMIRSNNTFAMRSEIFDSSGCEKAAPVSAKKVKTDMESESNNSSIRVIDASHRKVKKENISLSSSTNSDTESSRDISSCAARLLVNRERICCKRKQTDFVEEPTEIESDAGNHRTVRKRKRKENRDEKAARLYVVPRKTRLTEAQKEIANWMAQKTQKGSDLFVKILTPSNIHTCKTCVLNLPDGFACKVLRRKKKKITLLPADLDKGSNICTANYCKNESIRCIGKGWREFTCINGLKQGDLCLFELRKKDERGILTMVVHFNHE
ncbi:B3 domain-containing protein Os03g0620400-like isoform X2 [Carex rostrata]